MRALAFVLIGLLTLLLALPLCGEAQQFQTVDLTHPTLRGLVGWWRGVPGLSGGDRMLDLSGNLRPGTLTNMGFSTTSGWSPSDRRGGAWHVNFDGANDFVSIGTASDFQFANTTCTWMGWVRATGTCPSLCYLITKRITATGSLFVRLDAGLTLSATIAGSVGAAATRVTLTNTWTDGTWRHFAVVFTTDTTVAANNQVTIYTNGVLDQGALSSGDVYVPVSVALTLGMHSDGVTGPLSGALDDIRFYNRGLDATEIAEIVRLGLLGDLGLIRTGPDAVVFAGPQGVAGSSFFPFFR